MSQQIRLEYPGSLWHVIVRGTSCKLFRDDLDRKVFLKLLGRCVDRANWTLLTYVLLPTEFRLLLQLNSATLSRGMQWLNSVYAQRFNRRHSRVGHLVHGRFDGRLIDEETYFADVIRDMVLAPVRAGLAAKPDEYRWSSHAAILGKTYVPKWLAADNVLRRFGGSQEKYQSFVADEAAKQDLWSPLIGDIYLGGDAWLSEVRRKLAMKPRSDARSRLQRTLCTLRMADVIEAIAGAWSTSESMIRDCRGGAPRTAAAWVAANETLLTNRQIAVGLRLRSSARVAALIRNCDRALEQSMRLRIFVNRAVSTLRRKM